MGGFGTEFLEDAFQVNKETVRNLQGKIEDEEKGAIVKVKGGLSITSPPLEREQQEQEDEDEDEQRPQRPRRSQDRRRDSNGIDETICAMRLRHNIGQSSSPDIYNPQAGSIKASNSLDFPALRLLRLSAEFGTLRKVCISFMTTHIAYKLYSYIMCDKVILIITLILRDIK